VFGRHSGLQVGPGGGDEDMGMQPGNVLIYPEIDPEILGT